jgi:hypothetical protein
LGAAPIPATISVYCKPLAVFTVFPFWACELVIIGVAPVDPLAVAAGDVSVGAGLSGPQATANNRLSDPAITSNENCLWFMELSLKNDKFYGTHLGFVNGG